MYQGKRYNDSRFGSQKRPSILLRVILSLSVAVIISFGLIIFGARLGEKVPDDLIPEGTETEAVQTAPDFQFKDVDAKNVSEGSVIHLFGEEKPSITVLNVSDDLGRLNCITSINSLLYGDAVDSELRPIEALLYEAKLKAEKVSVRFTPFVNENAQEYADLCSAAILSALSEYEIEEIVLCLDNVSPSTAAELKSRSNGRVKLGGAITLDVLSNEALVKEYYKALDFLVLDLTGMDIKSYKSESDTPAQSSTEAGTDGASISDASAQSIESVLEGHSLSIIKYSVRLRVTCENENDLSDFLEFYRSFGLCGYEIDGEKNQNAS